MSNADFQKEIELEDETVRLEYKSASNTYVIYGDNIQEDKHFFWYIKGKSASGRGFTHVGGDMEGYEEELNHYRNVLGTMGPGDSLEILLPPRFTSIYNARFVYVVVEREYQEGALKNTRIVNGYFVKEKEAVKAKEAWMQNRKSMAFDYTVEWIEPEECEQVRELKQRLGQPKQADQSNWAFNFAEVKKRRENPEGTFDLDFDAIEQAEQKAASELTDDDDDVSIWEETFGDNLESDEWDGSLGEEDYDR